MASASDGLTASRHLARRMAEAWNQFWFSPGDPTPLGLIRLVCGFTVFYVHLAYGYDLQAFFGKHAFIDEQIMSEFRREAPIVGPPLGWEESLGITPRNPEEQAYFDKWGVNPSLTVSQGHALWSIWYHVTDPTWMWITHGTILFIMFLFAIGFCTRVTGVLTWLGMLSYIQRAPTSLFGMDTIMTVVVLYLIIGPSGAALSVDRLIGRFWATYQALRSHQPVPPLREPTPSISANFALRLLQIHVCIIYLVSGISKLQGGMWWGGTAVWATMANYEFSPMRLKLYMDTLRYLSAHRWLWELVMTGGTYATLLFEVTFAFLVWNRRLRWTMLLSAVMLHVGIALIMGLVTFSMMMMTAVLAFIPAETVRQIIWRLGGDVSEPQAGLAKG